MKRLHDTVYIGITILSHHNMQVKQNFYTGSEYACRLVMTAQLLFSGSDPYSNEFSLSNLPTTTSSLVVTERNDLNYSVNFQALAQEFFTLSSLARDPHLEANSFGDVILQNQVHVHDGLVGEVSSLIDKSNSTVGSFKDTTDAALQFLIVAFQFITNDDGKKAIEELKKVSELAEKMAKQSAELQKHFETKEESAQKLLEELMTAQGVAKQRKAALEEKQRELEVSKRGMEELARSALDAGRQAHEMARQADESAARAKNKIRREKRNWTYPLKKLVGRDDAKKYKDREKAAREEQRKFNEQRRAHQNKYDQAQREIQELESSISNSQFDANCAANTIDGLQKLTGTFKSLSATTHKIVGVWERLQLLCVDFQNALPKKDVEEVASDNPADREAVWSSSSFQESAVRLYARWLALQEESSTFSEQQARGALN